MEYEDNKLKLIYVLKIGYNSKFEGLYEFIFSLDETNVDEEGWFQVLRILKPQRYWFDQYWRRNGLLNC